jgi:hypothetical protein
MMTAGRMRGVNTHALWEKYVLFTQLCRSGHRREEDGEDWRRWKGEYEDEGKIRVRRFDIRRRNVFPVRYGLNFYIVFRRNSVFNDQNPSPGGITGSPCPWGL